MEGARLGRWTAAFWGRLREGAESYAKERTIDILL